MQIDSQQSVEDCDIRGAMEQSRSGSGNAEENNGIPDDLRCKRSDGKQWRCTAMSMPDKTVCEKHYIQAKRRAANSALRASLKKAKRKTMGDGDVEMGGRSNDYDLDMPLPSMKLEECNGGSALAKKKKEKGKRNRMEYSSGTPSVRGLTSHGMKSNEDSRREFEQLEENWKSYKTSLVSAMDSSRNGPQRSFSPMMEQSIGSMGTSEESGGQICHQCRRNDRERVNLCLKCNQRGYCDNCISAWYPDISPEEIKKACPACRGSCNCEVCLRADNIVKNRIREISVLDKLQNLYRILSSVLPVVKQLHHEQCSEVELEKKLRGTGIDLARARLNADEQMCCNICRVPIVDYYRHCTNCSYDLCLTCCQDLREASLDNIDGVHRDNDNGLMIQDSNSSFGLPKASKLKLDSSAKFPGWRANSDGSIPCPPKEYGGCGNLYLNLGRIFKMNWVAKLVKNLEEMVGGCRVSDTNHPINSELNDSRFYQCAYREGGDDNWLYCPSSQDIKSEGITNFRKHWQKGQPVIIKNVHIDSSISMWDPEMIWRGIQETADEKLKEPDPLVKATDCLDGLEVDIRLSDFIKGYSEGRSHDDGLPEMLKLKDWPPPCASEEYLFYQRPEFISKLPLLEYVHPRLGILNVAAKLPHYSLQNDAGPKIYMSYGTYNELGGGDSVINLHYNMRDMVYVLLHKSEVNHKGELRKDVEMHNIVEKAQVNSFRSQTRSYEGRTPDLLPGSLNRENGCKTSLMDEDEGIMDQRTGSFSENGDKRVDLGHLREGGDVNRVAGPGAHWDIFRRKDVPKLVEYLRIHHMVSRQADCMADDFVTRPLYEGFFLYGHHKRMLKNEYGVEPWSFDQHPGEAVFIPAGCPFQVRNLQSNVQVGLDFLFPESVGEAVRLFQEIRCLPNEHEAKLQVLEIGKISLYAASSAIKEAQKLVLDPKFSAELGFEDHNLTAAVASNLEKVSKRPRISCP